MITKNCHFLGYLFLMYCDRLSSLELDVVAKITLLTFSMRARNIISRSNEFLNQLLRDYTFQEGVLIQTGIYNRCFNQFIIPLAVISPIQCASASLPLIFLPLRSLHRMQTAGTFNRFTHLTSN